MRISVCFVDPLHLGRSSCGSKAICAVSSEIELFGLDEVVTAVDVVNIFEEAFMDQNKIFIHL